MTAIIWRVAFPPQSGPINPASTLMECNRDGQVESWRSRESAMRFALWRKGKEKAQAETAVAKPAPAPAKVLAPAPSGDIDLHAIGAVLSRKRGWIIVPTVLAFVLSLAIVNVITPRYKSEARIL